MHLLSRLGLAKIRESNLDEGSRDLEIAASLDPNSSLMRSYLGKAYFEEKRTGLDEREYAVAKELDPRDPTPWSYDAIAKQTTKRPVEALHDLQQAIELNDNRAVYRSRLSFWTLAKQQVVPGTRDETRHDHVVLPHCLITEGMGEIVGTKALGVLRVMRSSHVEKRPIGPGEPEGLWLLMRPSWE